MARPFMRSIGRAAPAVCAALLISVTLAGGIHSERREGVEAYHARVRDAVEKIPYRVASYVGADSQVPTAAVRLLKPNAMLQRRYEDLSTKQAFSLLIVHCGDARDMLGHYPPVCYPAHGWLPLSGEDQTVTIAGVAVPARRYAFSRVNAGVEQRMTVLNFFVLPEGEAQIAADMDAVTWASRNTAAAGLGAAQVQIIVGPGETAADLGEVCGPVLSTLEPIIRVIADGMHHG